MHRRGRGGNRDFHGDGRGPGHGRGGGGGRGRPPPGLKGREIGLWFRDKAKQASKDRRPKVEMDSARERHIQKLLQDVRNDDAREGASASSGANSLPPTDGEGAGLSPEQRASGFYSSPLVRDPRLDQALQAQLQELQASSTAYQHMQTFRHSLPSYTMKDELLKLVNQHQVVVVSGETGCGKTTQVAQFILDDCITRGQGSTCRVVCTQPRRISAITIAERVASERGEQVGRGNSVGYQIRLEAAVPRPQGSILYCTTGILLTRLKSDRLLSSVSHVILDEVHERTIHSDFLMIILRDLLPLRPDLKLILMSATLNAQAFSQYFHHCPMLTIPGFTYPVTRHWIEDIFQATGYQPPAKADRPQRKFYRGQKQRETDEMREQQEYNEQFESYLKSVEKSYPPSVVTSLANFSEEKIDFDLIVELLRHICTKQQDGAILIFLTGWVEISTLNDKLMKDVMFRNANRFLVIPLHSMMPTTNQKQVFERPPEGVRKIVIATNIAETSITINDVVYVIDAGKVKESNFDVVNNLSTLKPEWISKAAARQRRGRAGRVQSGVCYHLYSKLRESLLQEYQQPEILRTPLEEVCLQIKLLKLGGIEDFIGKAMETPDPKAIHLAIDCLKQLNALDGTGEELTPLGYHLAQLPVQPRVGKMILMAAMFSCLDPVLTIAASLGFKDPFVTPLGKEAQVDAQRKRLAGGQPSDHLMLVQAYRGWEEAHRRGDSSRYCWDNFLSFSTLRMLQGMRTQFAEHLSFLGFLRGSDPKAPAANLNSGNSQLVKACLCAGLYPNVASIKQKLGGGGSAHHRSNAAKLYTKTDGRVQFHPKSVNYNSPSLGGQWLVYCVKVKSTGIFLHDSTVVEPYPLLFFGGDIDMGQDGEQDVISVDQFIVFQATPRIASLVMELRQELDKVLESKISVPGLTNWNQSCKEGRIIRAIVDLLTMESDQADRDDGGHQVSHTRGHHHGHHQDHHHHHHHHRDRYS